MTDRARSYTVALIFAISFVLAPSAVGAQDDMQDVEIQVVDVAPGVYMLIGRGGNIGVSVGDDAIFLIDDQYAPLNDKIEEAVRRIQEKPIAFVLNTHWHGDHTGGNELMGEAGALIVAHDNVRKRMSTDQIIEAFNRTIEASPEGALPVVTFSRDVTFHINDDDIHAFHVEHAHTDGDAIVHFKNANVIHMGDTFFASGYPFIDVSSGGSIGGVINAAEKVLKIADADTKIMPGHGPLSSKADLETYRDMLVGIRDAVAAEIANGKGHDEVLAAKPTAKYDAEWGGAYFTGDQFTEIVYSDLARGGE